MAEKKIKGTVQKLKEIKTGLESELKATVVLPDRSKVIVPVPDGNLFFLKEADGDAHVKGYPTHVEDISSNGRGKNGKVAIQGVLTKSKYLSLVRLGCTIKDGCVVYPKDAKESVRKLLKF